MGNKIFILTTAAYLAASQDAERRYPEESCGFILNDSSFVSVKNIAIDKQVSFVIGAKDWDRFKGEIKAVVHSHPDGSQASTHDAHAQYTIGLPYIILLFSGTKVGSVITIGNCSE